MLTLKLELNKELYKEHITYKSLIKTHLMLRIKTELFKIIIRDYKLL